MCAHGYECTHTHDAIHDVFAKEVGLHVAQEQLHVLPSTFQTSKCHVDIALSMCKVWMLENNVMVYPTHANLLSWESSPQGFTISKTKQKIEVTEITI
jgi:hypothetical protein